MSQEQTIPTSQEQRLMEACQQRYCGREIHPSMLVTVQVGDKQQQWCPDCVESEFGLDYSEYEGRQESLLRYVTPPTVAAFLSGVVLTLIITSVMVV